MTIIKSYKMSGAKREKVEAMAKYNGLGFSDQ